MSKSTDITAHVNGNAPMNVGIGGYADARFIAGAARSVAVAAALTGAPSAWGRSRSSARPGCALGLGGPLDEAVADQDDKRGKLPGRSRPSASAGRTGTC